MHMRQKFKKPDEPSDSDDVDDLADAQLEEDEEIIVRLEEPWSEEEIDEEAEGADPVFNIDDENSDDDGSSEFDEMATDSDEFMNEDDNESHEKQKSKAITRSAQASSSNDIANVGDEGGGGGGGGGGDGSSREKTEGIDGGSILELDENEEDDGTVKAIISAIKKGRSTPPEIKSEDFITDICFHPERDIIALATINGDVVLYEYTNEGNTLLRTIEVHAKACRDVEFTEDGLNILTCSKDKSIMVTDLETEKLKKFYESAHDEAINKIHVLDENIFATGDDGGTVKLWDLRTKSEIFGLKEVEDYITQLLTNDAKKLLLVTSGDGYLTTINIAARKLYVQSEPYEEELNCMGIFRGDSKLVVGSSKGNLYTYNWGQFGYHCDKFPGVKSPMSEMVPITDRIACVGGEEGIIRAVHIAPYRNLGVVGQHSMPIESLDINHSGELIASSSHNNDIRFWNIKYFEEFGDIKYNEKHNSYKEKRHNLPSSKFSNTSDFFSDLAKKSDDEA